MDPKAALEAVLRGHRVSEHARAYNEWRRSQGFAVRAYLPELMRYTLGPNDKLGTILVDVDRVYRGHRGVKARCERHGGQGFVYVYLSALTLA